MCVPGKLKLTVYELFMSGYVVQLAGESGLEERNSRVHPLDNRFIPNTVAILY